MAFKISLPATENATEEAIRQFARAAETPGSFAVQPPLAAPTHGEIRAAKDIPPWDGMDDQVDRPRAYTVNFPPSLYAKMQFLKDREPGGPSIRTMVLQALEPYVTERLKKHGY